VLGPRIEPGKLGPVHMDQSRVVPALKVQLLLLIDAAVDDHVQPVARAHRRNRAGRTVAEDVRGFRLAGQVNLMPELRSEVRQLEMMRGGKNGERVAATIVEHDSFGQPVTRDVTCVGGPKRRQGRFMRDQIPRSSMYFWSVGAMVMTCLPWGKAFPASRGMS
jgi:hypothetical protein